MSLASAPLRDVPTSVLIDRLSGGWHESHSGLLQEFVQRWEAILDNNVEVSEITNDSLRFVTDLSHLYLRATHKTPCLMLGGNADVPRMIGEFFRKIPPRHGVPIILPLSDRNLELTRTSAPKGRCLVIPLMDLKQMTKEEPYKVLRALFLEQIPRRRLNPYNLLLPAEGSLFVGRENELGRLFDEENTSFAIAGPGRIGKTSLMNGYKQLLIRAGDSRMARCLAVDFYDCDDFTADGVARFFAMEIGATIRSWQISASKLVKFMKYQYQRLGGPPELLLDEVDMVCSSDAFKFLGAAARAGLCRLIMCGKGDLLKTMLRSKSPLECRLELIQLQPLQERYAFELLLQPLSDLGFDIVNKENFASRVLQFTGRLPHLIQLCGEKLVEYGIQQQTGTLTEIDLDRVEADFETEQYFTNPLEDLNDPITRLIGLSVIKHQDTRQFSAISVQAMMARIGVYVDLKRAKEICNDLVINNILAWSNGAYCVANKGLSFYFKRGGNLENAINKATRDAKIVSRNGNNAGNTALPSKP